MHASCAWSSVQHCPRLLLAHVVPPTASTSSWVVGFWDDPDSVGQDSAEQPKGGYAWWPMLRDPILGINNKVSASHKPPVTLEIVILCWKPNSACSAQGCSVTLGQEMPRWDQPLVVYALEGKTSHCLVITPSPFIAITIWMGNSCDICRTKAVFGSYTELLQDLGLPPLICKRCQVSLNLPLSFQLCVCGSVCRGRWEAGTAWSCFPPLRCCQHISSEDFGKCSCRLCTVRTRSASSLLYGSVGLLLGCS